MNVSQNVERGSRYFPEQIAIRFEGRSISYRQLDRQVNRLANVLLHLGIGRGDRVALFLPNIPEFIISYHAAQKIGAVAVSLNAMLKRDETRFILNDCGARILITTEIQRSQVEQHDSPALEQVLIAEGTAAGGDQSLKNVMEQASDQFRALEMDRDEPAAILYTSGTTGFPKGATLSHGNVVSNQFSTLHNCGMHPKDRLHLVLPLFHCFGQNFIMNSGLNACATLILQRHAPPEQLLEEVCAEKVTVFFGVPSLYISYLNNAVPLQQFQSVRYFFTAAAIMPAEIAARWQEQYRRRIYEGYGLTETSPFASYNHYFRYKLGSIGTPIENVEMKVVDEHGTRVEPGQWGEIAVQGPNVMLGYWNRPEDTAQAIREGWFYTGDVGMIDDEGYFYICDRVKDMVITSGYNVYPAEVENIIYSHPDVAEVAVYGIPDSVKGESVKASIVLKEGRKLESDDVIRFCRQKMANYKVPRQIEFVDRIPKGATGKVLKRVLRGDVVKPT